MAQVLLKTPLISSCMEDEHQCGLCMVG